MDWFLSLLPEDKRILIGVPLAVVIFLGVALRFMWTAVNWHHSGKINRLNETIAAKDRQLAQRDHALAQREAADSGGGISATAHPHSTTPLLPFDPEPCLTAEPQKRQFLPPEETIRHLRSLTQNHTAIQLRTLAKPYEGKWLEVTGYVHDIDARSYGYIPVYLLQKDSEGEFYYWTDVMIGFEQEWRDRLKLLNKSDFVRIQGMIDRVTDGGIGLSHCELIEPVVSQG